FLNKPPDSLTPLTALPLHFDQASNTLKQSKTQTIHTRTQEHQDKYALINNKYTSSSTIKNKPN
ncbi:hypothetical protein, partial [Escherichia coli]|uniref:hypothetical protein n=1 Tax=Escherichia coli TaxID=562 RepID=UPI0032D9B3D9